MRWCGHAGSARDRLIAHIHRARPRGGGEDAVAISESAASKQQRLLKKARSSYVLFCGANRQRVMAEGNDFGATARRLAAMWKALSAEERQPYVDRAREEKLAFVEARSLDSDDRGEDAGGDGAAESEDTGAKPTASSARAKPAKAQAKA